MTISEYVPVAAPKEVREEGRMVVSSADHAIALFDHDGEVYAVDNRCPHVGFPLSEARTAC